jgi:hypothetical protein
MAVPSRYIPPGLSLLPKQSSYDLCRSTLVDHPSVPTPPSSHRRFQRAPRAFPHCVTEVACSPHPPHGRSPREQSALLHEQTPLSSTLNGISS